MDALPDEALLGARRAALAAHLANAIAIAALFAFGLATYDGLPARIPAHFDASGAPDRWVDKSLLSWLALPLVALGLSALIYGAARIFDWARKHPRFLNLPDKERFLALPPERQAPLWQRGRNLMYWIALPVNGMILYGHWATWAQATGRCDALDPLPLFGLLAVTVVGITLGMLRWIRAIRRAVERSAAPR
ncbi:MAG: DUF1648 domain-containing protein [Deltaproteobacteria bacterium]|nr:DUF1648 domain-containing protein [Deltaproteobacteria bacterium]